ncbi:MAG: hypothetical protein JWL59_389 [Chthoniobacteraceae bacterium]|nr:hypothetical protein [Chthoniobacteraceae bacterium]
MISKFSLLFLGASAMLLSVNALAAPVDYLIGTTNFPTTLNDPSADINAAQFQATDAFGTGSAFTIFTNTPFLASNQTPYVFTLSPGDAGFSQFAALLTNGVNNQLQLLITARNSAQTDTFTATSATGESERFFPNGGPNDFAGNTISRIVLNVKTITFTPNGPNPPNGSFGTNSSFNASLDVYGLVPIPEPGMLLSGLAMVTMTGLCRPRRRVIA